MSQKVFLVALTIAIVLCMTVQAEAKRKSEDKINSWSYFHIFTIFQPKASHKLIIRGEKNKLITSREINWLAMMESNKIIVNIDSVLFEMLLSNDISCLCECSFGLLQTALKLRHRQPFFLFFNF